MTTYDKSGRMTSRYVPGPAYWYVARRKWEAERDAAAARGVEFTTTWESALEAAKIAAEGEGESE